MRDATCPHLPPCPGCPRFGIVGAEPRALAALNELAEKEGVPPPRVVNGPLFGFRHRVRLAVRGRANNPKLGLFELGTHRVVHIPECRVHHPLVNDVARVVRGTLAELAIPPYSDTAHAGRARYLQVVIARESQSAQVVLVTNDSEPTGLEPLFDALCERLGARLHSLFWNGNTDRTNTILGPVFRHLSGPEAIVESVNGVRLHYPPGAFGQSNLPLADRLARRVGELVPDGARVLELYAGVGALGLPLAERAARLALNEHTPDSLRGLAAGVAELSEEVRARVAIHAGPAQSQSGAIAEADHVIADPPRRGLDAGVIEALVQTPVARLIYVSCGLDSFLAQARALLDSGRYALEGLEAFVMVPYTEHIETLAWFRGKPAASAPT